MQLHVLEFRWWWRRSRGMKHRKIESEIGRVKRGQLFKPVNDCSFNL